MQPFESDRFGPLAARVYRVKTADDVELAVTRLGNGSDDPTGEDENLGTGGAGISWRPGVDLLACRRRSSHGSTP